MESVYIYFNPQVVELIAKAKFGSMNKFLAFAKREPSWWHRSKKKPTIKWYDVEQIAELLECHPSDFLEDGPISNMAAEPSATYTPVDHGISLRIGQLITLKAGDSQAQFAELTGIGQSQVSNIITKKHSPGYPTLAKIITAFPELNARWLITGQGTLTTPEKDDKNLRALCDSKDEIIKLLRSQVELLSK